jgi:hypothetical protein
MTQDNTASSNSARRAVRRLVLACAALALATAAALAAGNAAAQRKPATTGKTVYCWDDASGKRVCGDALPAEATDRARTEINAATGMRRRELDRALTEDERAAADAAAEVAAREAATEAAQLRRELAMVESYATEAELRGAYRYRIELTEGAIKSSLAGVANLRQSLVALLRQAGELELAGRPVPEALGGSIMERHRSLERQQVILQSQVAERATLDDELDDAVTRYRELKKPQAEDGARTAPAPDAGDGAAA